MNYQHAYHAGSFADVVKHMVEMLLLEYLQKKPTPYCYIDTHAGEGSYDWATLSAQKTSEAMHGVYRLMQNTSKAPESVARYIAMLQASLRYPGSPMVAAQLARSSDHLILNEMHPKTFQVLKQNMQGTPNLAIHQRDAYEFLPAVIPPPQKRGLVLMDPSFEDKLEMDHVLTCLRKCALRFAQGMYLIWLPIVGRSYYTAQDLRHAGFEDALIIEFCVNTPSSATPGMIGCSLLLFNPPWQIEATITPVLEYLWQVLHVDANSSWRCYKV